MTSSAQTAPLTFRYDAAAKAYTVSGSGASSTFGAAQTLDDSEVGDALFTRQLDGGRESLTLFNPKRLGGRTQSVSLGLWQRRTNTSGLQFDVFVYGFPTKAAQVPVTGSATYDIDLFGVASPVGYFPRSVIGDGTFSLDFAHGLFAMSGQAGEYNNDADYSTCCATWRGAGYLGASGGFTGYFSFDGREGINYRSSISGALYGSGGKEIGGTILGNDGTEATFTGAFAGTQLRDGIDASMTVLDKGARKYYSFQGTSAASQRAGATSSDSNAYYFPATFGSVEFGADGGITPMFLINDPRFQNVTFSHNDRIAQQSDNRFDVYEVHNGDDTYRLEMFKPGAGNPEIALTYSSFGHWREDRPVGEVARHSLSTWFSYGARTLSGTLPAKGAAHFNATVLGSGERLGDMAQLTLKGTSAIDIDFATARVDGTFTAAAWTAANEAINLPLMTFSATGNAYAFDTLLFDAPGHSDGSIRGSLYGPGGEEIGGAFEFFTRVSPGGAADAVYSGAFFGKRN
ncbi:MULTISPECIES: transferrin-binding protein-like solute binding protein [unclassified Novosphingobium]|uniref:transferrin-binding protein-like solute binding protein n=1 Tax=unclassified Novosphingobium TaxID=2644732 RepID=UPI0013575D6C|nr:MULTISPECIES: transferrin-binding protein-like solute binding protein [unclassified Novosphingobium]